LTGAPATVAKVSNRSITSAATRILITGPSGGTTREKDVSASPANAEGVASRHPGEHPDAVRFASPCRDRGGSSRSVRQEVMNPS
jgi:hypothetical protein